MIVDYEFWRVIAVASLVYAGIVSVLLLLAVISLVGYWDRGGRQRREDRE